MQLSFVKENCVIFFKYLPLIEQLSLLRNILLISSTYFLLAVWHLLSNITFVRPVLKKLNRAHSNLPFLSFFDYFKEFLQHNLPITPALTACKSSSSIDFGPCYCSVNDVLIGSSFGSQ